MRIKYHRQFEKRFKKLSDSDKKRVIAHIKFFLVSPKDPRLKDHKLQGQLKHLRAFRVGGDIRVIYKKIDGYTVVLLLDIGAHDHVYGK